MLDLRHISFYKNGNAFFGSQGKFRFKIDPDGETLHVYVWTGDKCFECSDPGEPVAFPLSEEGLKAVEDHLEKTFSEG